MAHVSICSPRIVGTPPKKDNKTVAVEKHVISRGNWDYPYRRYSNNFRTVDCICSNSHGAQICFQTSVLYECDFAKGYISIDAGSIPDEVNF
jgi:hypothetical protein